MMGTPLPPNKDGNLCAYCWGIGKKFGDIPTPRYVKVQLANLQPGEFWNPDHESLLLYPHILSREIVVCSFSIDDGIFEWRWELRGGSSTFEVQRQSDGKLVTIVIDEPVCQTVFQDPRTSPVNRVAVGSLATVSFF